MRRLAALLACCAVVTACVTPRPASTPAPWQQRSMELQRASAWQLDGRAAVAVGTQGWQASVNWRQRGPQTELRLAGPLGVGALVLKATPEGLALNGAPPSDSALTQLEDKLGFQLPINELRYWLLGVPSPGSEFTLTRNVQDRAQQLTQDGWTVDYDRYLPIDGDLLPTRMVLSRDSVRVRIAGDHWEGPR